VTESASRLTSPTTSHYFSRHTGAADATAGNSDNAGPQKRLPVTVAGHTLELTTGSGVFSRKGLDDGSRILLENTDFASSGRICDLGCGWGAVACFASVLAPEAKVWMCDINLRAVQLAKMNAEQNKFEAVTAWCGDGLGAMRSLVFDTILCNPPVRAGNVVIARLFDDAHRCLSTRGSLWIVLRTAQGAKSWQKRLTQQFGNCETIAIKGGYRILRSCKQN